MKIKVKQLIVILVLVVVGAGSIWVIKARYSGHAGHDASHEKALYYCPMHPTYTSDRPGECSICYMKLIKMEQEMPSQSEAAAGSEPLKEFTVQELLKMKPGEICLLHKCTMGKCMMAMTEEMARLGKCPHCGEDLGIIIKEMLPEGRAAVTLAPQSIKAIGVMTEPVKKTKVEKTIRTVGRIAYDPDLYQAQQEYLQSLSSLKRAQAADPEIKDQAAKLVESSKIKLRLLGLSDDLINEIETKGEPDRALLYSDPGSRVWLYAPIYEYEIPLVKVGYAIEAESSSIPGKTFQGFIRSIDSVLDPATRTVRVRATLENPEGSLKPEMYVNAAIKVDLGEQLVVSSEAVFLTGEKNIVFVAKGDNNFEPRAIQVGTKLDDFYIVTSGLGEGEMVVTSGNFLIDSESRLKASLQGVSSGGGHQHGT